MNYLPVKFHEDRINGTQIIVEQTYTNADLFRLTVRPRFARSIKSKIYVYVLGLHV